MRLLLLLLIPTLAFADAHPDDRLRLLELRLATDPNPALHLDHAELLRWAGRLPQAQDALDSAERFGAPAGDLAHQRALLADARAQPAEALRWLRIAVDAGAGPEAHSQLAERLRDGHPREALALLDQALALRSTPDLHLRRARLAAELGLDPQPVLQQGIQDHGAVVLRLERIALLRPHDLQAALAALDELLTERPEQPPWLLLKADLTRESGAPATELYEAVLAGLDRRVRRTAGNQVLRARVLLGLDRRTEAVSLLQTLTTPSAKALLATLKAP